MYIYFDNEGIKLIEEIKFMDLLKTTANEMKKFLQDDNIQIIQADHFTNRLVLQGKKENVFHNDEETNH